MRFGFETKKLWPFEDDYAKLNGNVAAAPNFATVRYIFGALSRAQIMHTILIRKDHTIVDQTPNSSLKYEPNCITVSN